MSAFARRWIALLTGVAVYIAAENLYSRTHNVDREIFDITGMSSLQHLAITIVPAIVVGFVVYGVLGRKKRAKGKRRRRR